MEAMSLAAEAFAVLRSPDAQWDFSRFRQDQCVRSEDGTWVVGRFHQVAQLLADDRFLSSPGPSEPRAMTAATGSKLRHPRSRALIFLDPPLHTVLRGVIAQGLRLDGDSVRATVSELVYPLRNAEGDLMQDVIRPSTVNAVFDIIGMHSDGENDLALWARDCSDMLDPIVSSSTLNAGMRSGLRLMVAVAEAARAGAGEDTVLGRLITARDSGIISDRDLVSNVVSFIAAALDTTQALISSASVILARSPDVRATVSDDRSLVGPFVDEVVRLDSPTKMTVRRARESVDLGFASPRANDQILLMLCAANRDEEKFTHANELRLDRSMASHLGFGGGPHRCVGAAIARSVSRQAIGSILDDWDKFEILSSSATRRLHSLFGGFETIPTIPRRPTGAQVLRP